MLRLSFYAVAAHHRRRHVLRRIPIRPHIREHQHDHRRPSHAPRQPLTEARQKLGIVESPRASLLQRTCERNGLDD